jgi:hypothetical protein
MVQEEAISQFILHPHNSFVHGSQGCCIRVEVEKVKDFSIVIFAPRMGVEALVACEHNGFRHLEISSGHRHFRVRFVL